jgi:hypothetical protein
MTIEPLTDSEIDLLQKGATGAGLLVAVSDRGFFDTFKEAGAMGKHVGMARRNSSSPLIQRVAEAGGTGFGLTASMAEVEEGTIEALRSSGKLLQAKAPDQLEAYRSYVLDLARSVSSAAGSGDDAESAVLSKIEEALAAPATTDAAAMPPQAKSSAEQAVENRERGLETGEELHG